MTINEAADHCTRAAVDHQQLAALQTHRQEVRVPVVGRTHSGARQAQLADQRAVRQVPEVHRVVAGHGDDALRVTPRLRPYLVQQVDAHAQHRLGVLAFALLLRASADEAVEALA